MTYREVHAFLLFGMAYESNCLADLSLNSNFCDFRFDPFKFNKLYLELYPRYCSAIFTNDVNNIDFLFK